jgi:hypothetical protein
MKTLTNMTGVRSAVVGLTLLSAFASTSSLPAGTAALWRFEEGPLGSAVPHGVRDASIGQDAIVDISGQENHLRTWDVNSAPLYVTDVPFHPVPQTGAANNLALAFGPGRDVFSDSKALSTHQFSSWTIEASFKADRVDLFQTIVGKDGNPIGGAPPVFLKILNNGHFELGLVDGAGTFQTVLSDFPLIPGEWYSVAGTATQWELSLWIKGPGDSTYVFQGFMPTDINGAFYNTAADFNRSWTVGRGMWGGALVDWFRGVVDEVRISSRVRPPEEFLGTSGSGNGLTDTLAYWRFEEGVEGERVPGPPLSSDEVVDLSGSGNDMRTWAEATAPIYVDDVPFNPVPQTGAANNLALSFSSGRDLYTIGKPINSLEFAELTVEASFKANVTNAWQVIVGKDGQPLQPDGVSLHGAPPFMFKTLGGGPAVGHLELGIIDGGRHFRSIVSNRPLLIGEWYSAAATATATELRLYLKGPGDPDYVLQGQPLAIAGAFTRPADFVEPADFVRPWTVGRGMWAGGAADWFNGIVDEVRISTVALSPAEFMAAAGAGAIEPVDFEVRAVIVERMENGTPRRYLGLEVWDVEQGTLQLQASPDLTLWQDTTFTTEIIEPLGGVRNRLRLTSNIQVDDHGRHFVRVRVAP